MDLGSTGFTYDNPQEEIQPLETEPQGLEPEPQLAPEPVEAPQDPHEERFRTIEDYLGGIHQYFQEQREQNHAPQPAPTPAAPVQRTAPAEISGNPTAFALWNEVQALRGEMQAPWERLEQQRRDQERTNAAYAQLSDQATQYATQRKQDGDPEVDPRSLLQTLAAMGMVKDNRIPLNTAMEYAYNALAYRSAKDRARNQAQIDMRKPNARIPAPFRAPSQFNAVNRVRPASVPAIPAQPQNRMAALKAEMAALDRELGTKTPDDIADSFGNFGG